MHRKILTNALGILLAAVIMAAPEDEPVNHGEQLDARLPGAPGIEREMHAVATPP